MDNQVQVFPQSVRVLTLSKNQVARNKENSSTKRLYFHTSPAIAELVYHEIKEQHLKAGVILAVFNANILFTFQAIKNLSAHLTYLCFGLFCKFFGDF